MRHPSLVACLLAWLAFTGTGFSHQDTPIRIESGKLVGLPPKYLPATFIQNELALTIRGKTVTFPYNLLNLIGEPTDDPFAENLVFTAKKFTYSFAASWYHHEIAPELPPYLSIRILTKIEGIQIEVSVDLDSGTVFDARIIIPEIGRVPIELGETGG